MYCHGTLKFSLHFIIHIDAVEEQSIDIGQLHMCEETSVLEDLECDSMENDLLETDTEFSFDQQVQIVISIDGFHML